MLDPDELFELESVLPDLGRPVLVQALEGFIDAGSARRLAREHLLGTLEHRLVATFDVDRLLDYRSRRPAMIFVEDHWDSYEDPALELRAVWDAAGTPFLLLYGPEPDVHWERFVTATITLIKRFEVRLTIGLNAIPMAVPHTRPIGVTAHATRKELVSGFEPWINTVQVPGSAGHLLEFRLGQARRDAMGFAVHIPHYVAQLDYPAAAVTLIDSIAEVAGLSLPTDALREAASGTHAEIETQVGQSEQVQSVVRALENQYDAYVGSRTGKTPLADAPLPTADELGAELERFLAEQTRRRGETGET